MIGPILDTGSGTADIADSSTVSPGQFGHRKTTGQSTATEIEHGQSSTDMLAKPTLKARLIYPLKTIRNRMLSTIVNGGCLGFLASIGAGIGTGATLGFTLGLIPQALDSLLNANANSFIRKFIANGVATGVVVGAFLGIGIGAVTALASVAIGLVLGVVNVPRDIYHAATLDAPRLDVPKTQTTWLAEKIRDLFTSFDD